VGAALERQAQRRTEVVAETGYRTLFDGSPTGLYRASPAGRLLEANPALVQMLGHPDCEALLAVDGDTLYVNPQDRLRWWAQMERDGVVRGFEKQLRRRDGTAVWVRNTARLVRDAAGQVLYLEGALEDITQRKRAEQALAARSRQLEAVRTVTAEITRELDLTAVLRLITRRAGELVGGVSGATYLWDESAQVLIPRAWHGLGAWVGDIRRRLGDGVTGIVAARRQGLIVNDYRNSPYRNPLYVEHTGITAALAEPLLYRDRLLGVIAVNREENGHPFTEQDRQILSLFADQAANAIENARLHQEIRSHAATLEERVRDRTRELEEARRQAETASRHKSEFLANMSHELRTPLNSILGFTELLQDQQVASLTEKQARYLRHIYRAGKHLLELISDILDLSKVEAGKLTLQHEPLAVGATLEDILTVTRQLAHEKSQTILAEIAPELPTLMADVVRFKQICFNLLTNAVKFTPKGGTIWVTARQVDSSSSQLVNVPERNDELTTRPIDASGRWLEVRVEDTGIGIKAEDLPRLFTVFTQLEAPATKEHEGTGLGLALSKRLVELHGGRIWAESEGEGRGSTFTVLLPFSGHGEGRK